MHRVAIINLVVSLFLIMLLAIILGLMLNKRQQDATVINLSGRQRMLSQKIAKGLYSLPSGHTTLNQIRADAQTWHLVHDGLIYGNDSLNLPPLTNTELLQLFEEVETYKEGLYEIVNLVEDESMIAPLLSEISANERGFLQIMDEIVFKTENIASKGQAELKFWTWLLSLLVIASLIFLYFNIIRPTVTRLVDSQSNLRARRNT